MLLAVDVGNSNTSLGLFENERLCAEFRLTTHRHWTRDEIAMALRHALALHSFELKAITAAVVACVVPPVLAPLCEALRQHVGVEACVVGPGVRTGMPIRYDPPQDVGADRIVAAVAAHHRYAETAKGAHLVVVDFGTATTFDLVGPKPEYLGGVIAPGVGISAEALFARASKLPRVEIRTPEKVVGRNTVAAIQSGLVYGYLGLVEGILGRIREELAGPVYVVATGGFGNALSDRPGLIDVVDESLILDGLRRIHSLNQIPAR